MLLVRELGDCWRNDLWLVYQSVYCLVLFHVDLLDLLLIVSFRLEEPLVVLI
jgi:hypothetical protein